MRRISYTARFKKDYRRAKAGPRGKQLDRALRDVLDLLVQDKTLPPNKFDHALSGAWKDFRDCHVRPDLLLIYRKIESDQLHLVRLGSHSELGF